MYIFNASAFLTVVETWLLSDWPWEISHGLLPLSRRLWALHICVLGCVVLRGGCEQSSKPVSGFTSVLSYLHIQLEFRPAWLIMVFMFNSPEQVCPWSSYLTGACHPDFGKHPVTQ